MPKISVIKFANRLEGRNWWRVAKVGKKVTTRVIMWGRIGFQKKSLEDFPP
jgi:hypothetical protein